MIKDFHYPVLSDDHFDAKPMVLLVGAYSTGKTSFIKYLLDQEFPGMHIGPEPTTDGFQAILHGQAERQLPGNALVSNPASAFSELSQFGNAFLQRFSGCEVASEFARGCTLIDTPGILAGRKQLDRTYSFEKVLSWFAPRCEMIILIFDANKVDISDELKEVIQLLEGYDDKIRVVLNKSDSLDPADLLKVNSALAWSLGRILKAPEVRRTYVGSFWDQPLRPSFMGELFERESHSLLADLASCPRNNATTKLNDLVMRTRRVRVQALIFHELRSAIPKLGSRDRKQKELISGLEDVFFKVHKQHNIPFGDFPDVNKFRLTLINYEGCRDFTKFKKLDEKLLAQLDLVLT
jgi:GTPase SAR1 family protein